MPHCRPVFRILSQCLTLAVLVTLSCTELAAPAFAQAQPITQPVTKYDSTLGYKYGVVPRMGTGIAVSPPTTITAPTVSDEGKGKMLGCAGMNYNELVKSSGNWDPQRFKNIFGIDPGAGEGNNSQVNLVKFFTTLNGNSPTMAAGAKAMLDASQQEAQAIQDRCYATQVKDDASAAVWQATLKCVQEKIGAAGNAAAGGASGWSDAALVTKSYHQCLYSVGADADYQGSGGVDTALTTVLTESPKWSGSLFDQIKTGLLPSFCGGSSNGAAAVPGAPQPAGGAQQADCTMLAFLPNYGFCVGGERDGQQCKSGTDRLSEPRVTPQTVFDMAFRMGGKITAYGMDVANKFMSKDYQYPAGSNSCNEQKTGVPANETAAGLDCLTVEMDGEATNNPRPMFEPADAAQGANAPQTTAAQYAVFMNCFLSDPSMVSSATDLSKQYKALAPINSSVVPLPDLGSTFTNEGDVWDKTRYPADSGAFVDKENIKGLLKVATVCTYNHQMRMGIRDYIRLLKVDEGERDAVLIAVRTHLAYQTTKNLLTFLRHKLNRAMADAAFVSVADKNSPAPYLRPVLQSLDSEVQNRLEALRNVEAAQVSYAQLLSNIEKVRARMAKDGGSNKALPSN